MKGSVSRERHAMYTNYLASDAWGEEFCGVRAHVSSSICPPCLFCRVLLCRAILYRSETYMFLGQRGGRKEGRQEASGETQINMCIPGLCLKKEKKNTWCNSVSTHIELETIAKINLEAMLSQGTNYFLCR